MRKSKWNLLHPQKKKSKRRVSVNTIINTAIVLIALIITLMFSNKSTESVPFLLKVFTIILIIMLILLSIKGIQVLIQQGKKGEPKTIGDNVTEEKEEKPSFQIPWGKLVIILVVIFAIWLFLQNPWIETSMKWKILGILGVIALLIFFGPKLWQWKKDSEHTKKDTESHNESEEHNQGHGKSPTKELSWGKVLIWTLIILIIVRIFFPHEAHIAYVYTREKVYRNDYFIPHDNFRKIKIDCRRISFFLDNDKDKVYVRTKHDTYIQEYVEETSTYIKRTANGQFIEEKTSIQYGNDISYFDFKALSEDGLWIRVVKSD